MNPNRAPRILVFDSGVGGLSVLDAIARAGFGCEIDYLADNAWLPYGLKSDAALRARVPELLVEVNRSWTPDILVLACNTASTIALDDVRGALTMPVVGVVPPIKPAAALSRTGAIGLLATPATVRRPYTDHLIASFARGFQVVRVGAAALVAAAEGKLRGEPPDAYAIREAVDGLFGAEGGEDIDVVALACTHFPLLAEELARAAPRPCVWLDSGAAIARRIAAVCAPPSGVAVMRNAGFTDFAAATPLAAAFRSRGFAALQAIGFAQSAPGEV